jgi:hypothetical protein
VFGYTWNLFWVCGKCNGAWIREAVEHFYKLIFFDIHLMYF